VAFIPVEDLFGNEEVEGSDFSLVGVRGDTEKGISVSERIGESEVFMHIGSPGGMV